MNLTLLMLSAYNILPVLYIMQYLYVVGASGLQEEYWLLKELLLVYDYIIYLSPYKPCIIPVICIRHLSCSLYYAIFICYRSLWVAGGVPAAQGATAGV